MTELRDDILSSDLTTEQKRIIVRQQFDRVLETSSRLPGVPVERSRSVGLAKNINEFYDLVRLAIDDRELQEGKIDDAKICYTEEYSDIEQNLESIVFSLSVREPGRFSEGAPFQGEVRNLRPIIREVVPDPEHPGYRRAVFGYWYDNVVRFTCWARTNREANKRALWFENLMHDYAWFFAIRGVPRVIFWRRTEDILEKTTQSTGSDTNKYYGRPLEYYVKTERIREFREKELENLLINVNVKNT
jgi:hypothetical protein